ncbi:MAG: hypothetical protein HOK28_04955 [Deltaproteobacteria bacterium]|jgi:hypothetical protein|nr:hypothetical protein [Deltaproteobacteria bacterium]
MLDEQVEHEMQHLFDETALTLSHQRSQSLGRFAAQIPQKPTVWMNPWLRHATGLTCMALAFALFGGTEMNNDRPVVFSDERSFAIQVDLINIVKQSSSTDEWEGYQEGMGFELFNSSSPVEATILEGSLDALLKENKP